MPPGIKYASGSDFSGFIQGQPLSVTNATQVMKKPQTAENLKAEGVYKNRNHRNTTENFYNSGVKEKSKE